MAGSNWIPVLYASFVLLGLTLGSFANVLIYRLPRDIPFVSDYSKCPVCGTRIRAYDLIPVVSFILLRGKCRACGANIPGRYPLVELAGGLLALTAAARYGLTAEGILYVLFFLTLLTVAVIDGQHMIIPDGLVITLAVLAVPLTALAWGHGAWYSRIAGFFALSLPMLTANMFIKDAFGGGDIKLIAVCGFLLGLGSALAAGFIGIVTAGARAAAIMLSGRPCKGVRIPFGPYLCFGVFAACLYGERIVNWYLGWL